MKFAVAADFLGDYPVRQVGEVTHREYWIPAGELTKFNEHMVGKIEIVREFRRGAAS